jgi:hypothetical protein
MIAIPTMNGDLAYFVNPMCMFSFAPIPRPLPRLPDGLFTS